MQHLQPRAEAEHNAGAHRVAGLSEQVVRRASRVVERQLLKERRELALAVAYQHLVDRGEVLLLGCAAGIRVYIEHKRLEQVGLTVVPEVVALALAGVADNDVGEHLREQRITAEVGHTVPGVAVRRVYQVEHLDLIAVGTEHLRCVAK